jgi:hypothetical protein
VRGRSKDSEIRRCKGDRGVAVAVAARAVKTARAGAAAAMQA